MSVTVQGSLEDDDPFVSNEERQVARLLEGIGVPGDVRERILALVRQLHARALSAEYLCDAGFLERFPNLTNIENER